MAEKKPSTPESDDEKRRQESGLPGGGKGRRDETDSKHGIFPYSVNASPPNADPELRTPGSLSKAPVTEAGRSELSLYNGVLVGSEQDQVAPEQTSNPQAEDEVAPDKENRVIDDCD